MPRELKYFLQIRCINFNEKSRIFTKLSIKLIKTIKQLMDSEENFSLHICPWCYQPSQIIWVHGHGQSSNCSYNIDECCRGENYELNNTSFKSQTEADKD